MNTKDWGPPTWKFTHKLTKYYTPTLANKKTFLCFFHKLGDVLPCKYCRQSYKIFIQKRPVDLQNTVSLMKWFYLIHGDVNNKLRKQGNLIPPDPPFSEIYNKYTNQIPLCEFYDCMMQFLYAVVWNYPINGGQECQKNIKDFYAILRNILPQEYNLQGIFIYYFNWTQFIEALQSRKQLKLWLYEFDKRIRTVLKAMWGLNLKIPKTFNLVDTKYEDWRATCSKGTCSKPTASTAPQCYKNK